MTSTTAGSRKLRAQNTQAAIDSSKTPRCSGCGDSEGVASSVQAYRGPYFCIRCCQLPWRRRRDDSGLAALHMRLALVYPAHLVKGVDVTHSLVCADVLYPREAQRKPAVVPVALLYAVKRHFKDNLWPDKQPVALVLDGYRPQAGGKLGNFVVGQTRVRLAYRL